MWMRTPILATALLALSACDDAPSTHPTDALAAPEDTAPRVDATTPPRDATPPRDMALAVDAVLPADATPAPDAAPAPPTRAPLPPPPDATQLAAPPGYTFARGLIHMHSVHSHDACDGDPKPGGLPNAPCLADLRAAVCRSRLDYMLLTDHPESFADVSFEEAVLHDAARRMAAANEALLLLSACNQLAPGGRLGRYASSPPAPLRTRPVEC
jgi:hypothetical protein